MTWNRRSLGTLVAMFVLAGVNLPFMADTLPVHWSDGETDSFAGKTTALFLIPLMTATVYALGWMITRHHEEGAIGVTVFALVAAGLAIQVAALIAQWGGGVYFGAVGGLVFVGLPWLTPREQNYLFGVRTTWTLRSERSWERSNRLGKYLLTVLGVFLIVANLAGVGIDAKTVVPPLIAIVVVVSVYSYFQWRMDPHRR